jgi:hypothetical protein
VDGAYLGTRPTPGEPVGTYDPLLPDTFYAVEILSDFVWREDVGSEWRYDAELSLNNGSTWGDIPGAGELCTVQNGDNTVFFIHTPATGTPQFKMRANSTSFGDNSGFLGYNIYAAEPGSSITQTGCVTQGTNVTVLGPYSWIPVADPNGVAVASTNASYAEISGLVAGNQYIIETSRGPWYDGESTYEDGRDKEFYSAEVSSDGGATWQPMNGHNPNVSCWEYTPDMKYYKIEFTVQAGQVWRIRVADTDSASYDDNTGNLAYTLKGLVLPADTPIQGGTFTLAGCNTPPVFPGMLEVGDLLNIGNYLAEWFDYTVGSVVSFFAWCPENTDMVTMFADDINKKDPIAMFDEMNGVLNDIKNEINGYNWGSEGTDYSVLTKSPGQASQMINQYVLGEIPDDSPWKEGDLVNFNAPMPDDLYVNNCNASISDYLGEKLGQGACFTINWARNIGLMFYIQLMLDVGVVFAALTSVLDSFKRLIYLFTGVNLSMMRSDQKIFVNLVTDERTRGRK